MKTAMKAALALVLLALVLNEANCLNCPKNGLFSCATATPPDEACHYYYCIYYPSLNRWVVTRYNCATGQEWNDTIKKCVTTPPTTPPPEEV
ncbi:unnamed protein product [Orchesella dallaii]|uniref:Chitin-binding type-2 domain-containing protein n=1 Tax=Orchesella dallaii TaxID=48710 RepID=A0ABP1RC75_9HEXA